MSEIFIFSEKRKILIEYVQDVLSQFKTFLPDMWRLWILYSTGTFDFGYFPTLG